MAVRESAVLFGCNGDELVGIIAAPDTATTDIGVLIIVGGPQYRVGSHRQFALLARYLAKAGIPCMRFDYRGMGDSSGESRSFEAVGDDVGAALDTFQVQMPDVRKVVLWGLCDGASAACFFAPEDPRVVGMVLLNPWVRTEAGEAKTLLRHYYLQRLLSAGFWKKMLTGGVSVKQSLGGLNKAVARAGAGVQGGSASVDLPGRMAGALGSAGKPFVVLLSGRDYVAREFEQATAGSAWEGLAGARSPVLLPTADHTFSSAESRDQVAAHTVKWVQALSKGFVSGA